MQRGKVKASYLGSEKISITDCEEKECNFYLIKANQEEKKTLNHHLLLLDISKSMEGNIEALKEKVKAAVDALKIGRNNYLSIIAYSGHGESSVLVKAIQCNKESYEEVKIFDILEKELYIKGETVVSEGLEVAKDIFKETIELMGCKKHVVLFTEGFLSPKKWSLKDEEEKILKLVEEYRENKIFLDIIAFGKHYDRRFLNKVTERAALGSFNHIDEINHYYKTIVELSKELTTRELLEFYVDNKDYFILNNHKRKIGAGDVKSFSKANELILVVFDEKLIINGEAINNSKRKIIDEKIKEDFLYSLAFSHVVNEDVESAEVAIAQTGDIDAYRSLSNCYSFLEKGKVLKDLMVYLKNREKRFKKGKVNIKASIEKEQISILEILSEILKDKESKLLWDYSYDYKRIGLKSDLIEDRYEFIKPKVGYGDVVDILIGSKKLNIGLRVKVEGEIIDKETNLKIDGHIFREYNLVLDGNINTDFISCKLSSELKKKFRKEKIIKDVNKIFGEEIITLDLRKLKVTNKALLKSLNIETIAEYLFKIEELKAKEWAIASIIKEIDLSENKKAINDKNIKWQIRKRYRIDEKGLYSPLKVKREIKTGSELYKARVLEWKIEKFPKTKKRNKALEDYKELIKDNKKEAIKLLKEIKKEKEYLLNKVNLVRLACGLNNKELFVWDDKEVKDKKENNSKLKVNSVIGGKVLISTKVINEVKLREDRYSILTISDS